MEEALRDANRLQISQRETRASRRARIVRGFADFTLPQNPASAEPGAVDGPDGQEIQDDDGDAVDGEVEGGDGDSDAGGIDDDGEGSDDGGPGPDDGGGPDPDDGGGPDDGEEFAIHDFQPYSEFIERVTLVDNTFIVIAFKKERSNGEYSNTKVYRYYNSTADMFRELLDAYQDNKSVGRAFRANMLPNYGHLDREGLFPDGYYFCRLASTALNRARARNPNNKNLDLGCEIRNDLLDD